MDRMGHVAGKKWLFWIMVPFYALLFGEIFVRLLTPVAVIPRYVTGAAYGVRVGMPNMKFWQTTSEARVQIRTNSRGIRADREYSYSKPPGTCRIVVFGDSLLVGYEVNLEDSFVYLLEKKLGAAGYRCEVINLAVSGFGTAEMLVTLREEGLKYHPDVVLFSSHVTDLDDNVRSSLYTIDDHGKLLRKNAVFLPGIKMSDELSRYWIYRWVAENSQLYSSMREHAAFFLKAQLLRYNKRKQVAPDSTGGTEREAGDRQAAGFQERLNLLLLEEARQVSESSQSRFCVLEIPFNQTRTTFVRMLPDYDVQTREALHIFNPLGSFEAAAAPTRKLFLEKGHGHLSPQGNEVLAAFFFSNLVATGWLHR
ncbi:MAG: hypothetical protein ABI771_02255 [Betaproteobacteria bacterium]